MKKVNKILTIGLLSCTIFFNQPIIAQPSETTTTTATDRDDDTDGNGNWGLAGLLGLLGLLGLRKKDNDKTYTTTNRTV